MKFPQAIPVRELAQRFDLSIIGDADLFATGINEIRKVEAGDITFSDVKKYFKKSIQSAATVILLNEPAECPPGKVLLIGDDPFAVYNQLILEHRPLHYKSEAIHKSALIHPSAIIEPGVVIGPHVRIGQYSHIMANVVIEEYSIIGDHVTIQPGSIIGSDAFYYKRGAEGHQKWRSGGRVIIEDRVEIGALNTINKGVSGDTVIGEGSKFDCQVHIGHGAVIGKHCLIAAQVAVGGKSIIGDRCVLYGQVGVVHTITIGPDTTVLAKSCVTRSIEGGKTYNGTPVVEATLRNRQILALRKLPELLRRWKG
ncbi:MAG: UDP-3-O-(3-hydroxymyristoyl)glucosamine N-acyltransferase [Bacteroidota bacterium]